MGISVKANVVMSGIGLKTGHLAILADRIEKMGDDWAKKALIVHRKSVLQILVKLIRFTPVDTGRLRGSWTPYFKEMGQSGMFMPYIGNPAPQQETTPVQFSSEAFREGQTEGFWKENGMVTTIGSNLIYAGTVEKAVHMVQKSLAWGRKQYRQNFERFFLATAKKGAPSDEKLTGK